MIFVTLIARSQQVSVSLSGGWVSANIEEADKNASGFRINGAFDYSQPGTKFSHGFSVGYLSLNQSVQRNNLTSDYTVTTFPIYYSPKYHFGKEKFQGFLKAALGMHFSMINRETNNIEVEDNDAGFYGGLGVGGVLNLKSNLFLSAEYEWDYLSNSYYRDGFLHSIMAGIGFRF
jgi:hypothetical protein